MKSGFTKRNGSCVFVKSRNVITIFRYWFIANFHKPLFFVIGAEFFVVGWTIKTQEFATMFGDFFGCPDYYFFT